MISEVLITPFWQMIELKHWLEIKWFFKTFSPHCSWWLVWKCREQKRALLTQERERTTVWKWSELSRKSHQFCPSSSSFESRAELFSGATRESMAEITHRTMMTYFCSIVFFENNLDFCPSSSPFESKADLFSGTVRESMTEITHKGKV